jgi:hypothetical protein
MNAQRVLALPRKEMLAAENLTPVTLQLGWAAVNSYQIMTGLKEWVFTKSPPGKYRITNISGGLHQSGILEMFPIIKL